jgi:invasion protein IalB
MPDRAFPFRAAWLRPLLAGLVLAVVGGAGTAPAQQQSGVRPGTPATPRPSPLGSFGDWTAAVYYTAGGRKVCYAFTRATSSQPLRQEVLLTITHRAGNSRDEVAIRAGRAYPHNAPAEVSLTAAGAAWTLYTDGDSAHVRPEDRDAMVAALRRGAEAVARGPGPGGRGTASDRFSLRGFTAAHEAISQACPAAARGDRR